MSKYIKAELYRITRSKSFISLVIFTSIFLVAFTFLITGEWLVSREALTGGLSFTFGIIALLFVSPIGQHFRDRTALYEIMDGTSPHILIWYRLIIYISLMMILFFMPTAIILLINDSSSGAVLQLLLTACILIRLTFFSICITLTGKNIESMMLSFARCMLENLFASLGIELGLWDLEVVSSYLPYGQITLLGGNIGTALILKIVIGAVLEMILMYILALASYRKKWAIKTVIM